MNKYSDLQIRKPASHSNLFELFTPKSIPPEMIELTPKHVFTRSSSKDLKISQFSQIENFRAETITHRILYTPQHLNTVRQLEKPRPPNFKLLLQNLNKISVRPDTEDHKDVLEYKIQSSSIKEKEFLYYKLQCKEKKSPLIVETQKKNGKIRWFFSKIFTKPNESSCDFTFFGDSFEVSEGYSTFIHEWYFISVQGLTNCDFSFLVKFGKKGRKDAFDEKYPKTEFSLRNLAPNSHEFREKLNQRVEQVLKNRKEKAKQRAGSKNFIKLNKLTSGSILSKETDPWIGKKESVLHKKQKITQEKIQKTKNYINRRILRLEKQQIDEKHKKILQFQNTHQKLWIKLIFFIKTSEILLKLIKSHRQVRLNQLRHNSNIRLIQKSIRSYLHFNKSKQLSLLTCRSGLTLMYHTLFKPQKHIMSQSLVSLLKQTYLNAQLPKVFFAFRLKIIKIQRQGRKFLKITKERIRALLIVWNSVLSKLLKENSHLRVNPYSRITADQRDVIVRKYYAECSEKYVRKVRKFVEELRSHRRDGVREFDGKNNFPLFECRPTEETIRMLINATLKSLSIRSS